MSTEVLALAALATIGLAVFGTGLYVASIGVSRIRIARGLREGGTTPLAEVPDASGLVAFEGTARTGDEGTLEAPLSGRDCLAYAIYARTNYEDETGREGSVTVDGEVSARVPFVVADDVDRVDVDPANAVLTLTDWETTETAWRDRADLDTDAIDRLELAGLDDRTDADPHGDARRQYAERRLEPGTEVTVFGGSVVESGDRADGVDSTATVGGDDWFEISIGDEPTVAPDRRRSGSLYLILGGLIALPGVGFGLAGIVGLVTTLL